MKQKLKFCPFCSGPLVIKFFENRDRAFCHSCGQPVYENPVPATAAVVLHPKKGILLVKRKFEPKKGEWCLPGGYLEIDETPEQCCLRELEEETGCRGKIDRLVGTRISKSLPYHSVLITGYLIRDFYGNLEAGDDAEEVSWFPLQNRPTLAFNSHEFMVAQTTNSKLYQNQESLKNKLFKLGLYVITSQDHVEIARKAVAGGARILQYRDKLSSRGRMLETAKKIRSITRKKGVIFIVNDYIDIALITDADGVHLGQDDLPLDQARKITPQGFIIGASTHSLEQALAAEKAGADYIGIGPVFATPTKESYQPIGIKTVKTVLEHVSIPAVAIGGLDRTNITTLLQAGVKNFAMVRQLQHNTKKNIIELNGLLLKRGSQ